jgi:AraC-like DNA-binding protein
MDRRAKMMDVSSRMPVVPHALRLPARPLSPWLRLAHVTQVRAKDATHRAFLRTIDDFELVFQLEQSSWIWSAPDGGSVDLLAGEVAFLPPGYLHGWGHEPGRHIAVHFDLHAKPSLGPLGHLHHTRRTVARKPLGFMPWFVLRGPLDSSEDHVLPLVAKLRAPRLWQERLAALVELWSRRAVRSLPAMLLAAEVLGWALRTISEDHAAGENAVRAAADERILGVVRLLDRPAASSLGERPSVSDLARRAGMGLTAFRAAFQRTMGRPPRQYLEERRIERAARALAETDHKILRIAAAEGYDDPYHFSRVFHRVMGTSPRAYRERARGK